MENQEEGEVDVVALYPAVDKLPLRPPPAYKFAHFFALDVGGKERHDQFVYRHPNGLCIIGLAPTHVALDPTQEILGVDYNVGKQSRAEMKPSGKRKKDARVLEGNSVLCKVVTKDEFFLIRCCVRGQLLEVNDRLMKEPHLLRIRAASEGHIAVMKPRGNDWLKAQASLISLDDYKLKRSQA